MQNDKNSTIPKNNHINLAIKNPKNHFAFSVNIDFVSGKYPSKVSYPSVIVGDCEAGYNAKRCIFIAYTHNRKNIKLKS